jgi:hypothetical protein
MESGMLGAMTHAALALAGAYEACTSRSRARKFLIGAVIGWHVYATYWHLRHLTKRS